MEPKSKTQAKVLKDFWSQFGGGRNDGRLYAYTDKIAALKEIAEFRVGWRNPPNDIRGKFELVKKRRVNRLVFVRCFACGGKPHVRHHIILVKNGGLNSRRNLIPLCHRCHAEIHPWLKHY